MTKDEQMNENVVQLNQPLIIADQTPDEKLAVMLFGSPEVSIDRMATLYGIAIADIVRHCANATGADVYEIMATIDRELENPSAELKRVFDG